MTTTAISAIGLQLFTTSNLQNEQTTLSLLNEQLASGHVHNDLTDYTPGQAASLISFQNGVTQRQAYISAMQNVTPRLSVYDSSMTDMENIAQQAINLATQNQTYDANTVAQLQSQAQGYLNSVTDDLNQEVNGRYIYAGSRYTTPPVLDLTTVPGVPTIPFVPLTSASPTLPPYDTDVATSTPAQIAAAYSADSVTVDTNQSLTYGVTSTNPAFQQLVAGLQLLNAATQPGVTAATYQTDIANAGTLLSTALGGVQTVHAGVAASINTITQQTSTQNTDITNLQDQLGNIQNADLTQVGVSINTLQTQLQASYSATSTLIQESILKYL